MDGAFLWTYRRSTARQRLVTHNELSASSIPLPVLYSRVCGLLSRHSSVVYHFGDYTIVHACDGTGFLRRRSVKCICHYIVRSRNLSYIGSEFRHKTEMSLLPWGPLIGYFVEHERKWFLVSEYRELPSLDEVPELLYRQVYR